MDLNPIKLVPADPKKVEAFINIGGVLLPKNRQGKKDALRLIRRDAVKATQKMLRTAARQEIRATHRLFRAAKAAELRSVIAGI
jgi:hypothetical protein